jgi:putative aldouronate transport system substrate-binding protein
MKKMLGILLVIVLAISFVGCSKGTDEQGASKTESQNEGGKNDGKQSENAEQKEEVISFDKKVEVSVFQWGPRDIAEDDAIIKHLNEKFNINLDVKRILAKEYNQNLEIKIAAGDIPDIFRNRGDASHIYRKLYEDDFLASFTEYAEKYNLKNILDYFNSPGARRFAEKDGYFQLFTNKGHAGHGIIIRQDWLKQLNLEMPKTWQEYKEMLRAFKENNLGGENTVPETGFEIGPAVITSYTGVLGWKKVDSKWTYEYTLPGYKDALAYLKSLYSEGLLDREIFTINESQANGKFISGKAGVIYTMAKNRFVKIEEQVKEKNPDAELSMIVPLPEGPNGIVYNETSGLFDCIMVPKNNRSEEKITRIMKLVDYMHSEEGIDILLNGIKGVHYTIEDNKRITNEAYERDIISGIGHLTAMLTDYSGTYKQLEGIVKTNYETSAKYGAINPAEGFSSDITSELEPLIKEVCEEWKVHFITGDKDLDKDWDEYIKALEKVGLNKLTQTVSEYLTEKGIE